MLIETEINIDDYKAYLKFVRKTNHKTSPIWILIFVLIGMMFSIILRVLGVHIHMHLPTAIGVGLLIIIIFYVYALKYQKKFFPERDGPILGRQTFKIDDGGVRVANEHYESYAKWSGVKSIKETDKHYFIMLDRIAAHIIPKRSFPDETRMQEMKDLIDENLRAPKVS